MSVAVVDLRLRVDGVTEAMRLIGDAATYLGRTFRETFDTPPREQPTAWRLWRAGAPRCPRCTHRSRVWLHSFAKDLYACRWGHLNTGEEIS